MINAQKIKPQECGPEWLNILSRLGNLGRDLCVHDI